MNNLISRILTMTLMSASCVAAPAAVVNDLKAGQLHEAVTSPATETTLTVTGSINANDLFFISEEMPELRTLDLSKCSIAACEIETRRDGSVNYREGVIPQSVFAGSKLENVILPASQNIEIAPAAFACSAIRSIALNNNVKVIGQGAFSSCPVLESASIRGYKNLGSHIFVDCAALKTVTLTNTDSVSTAMFARCTSLDNVNGSDRLETIGADAFAGCTSLKDITFGNYLRNIDKMAFAGSGLESVNLQHCKYLNNIGEWAFAHCAGLEVVVLPTGLTTLGRGVFFDCKALGTVILPETITTVGDYALKGLTSVEDLTLPAALGHIGTLAMSGMDNLKSINAENLSAVPTLGVDVWDRLDKSEVTLKVKQAQADEFTTTPQWQDFNIVPVTISGNTDITDRTDSKVTGRFEGNELVVRSEGDPLTQINVYDLSGRYLTGVRADDEIVRIDCAKFEGSVFIVEAYTASGVHAAVKLMRTSR